MELFKGSKICPATNAGYTIIENTEYPDSDGAILGNVLAVDSHNQYATWEYSYFPKSQFFNGFNEGHYISDKAVAYVDYYTRCAKRIEHLANIKEDIKSTQENVEKIKSITPFYPLSFSQAREKGEENMWRNSYRANVDCGKDIDKAISENYNNNCLDSKAALNEVVKKYGNERVSFLIAAKVNSSEWDMRYNKYVKAWAREKCEKYDEDFIKNAAVGFSSHSGLVDMMAQRIMTREQYRNHFENVTKDFVSADFQCDETGGIPNSLCWNFENKNVWLEPNIALFDINSEEYQKAVEICSDWGVRSCNDNEQLAGILKGLGNEAYENNASYFEETEYDMEQ